MLELYKSLIRAGFHHASYHRDLRVVTEDLIVKFPAFAERLNTVVWTHNKRQDNRLVYFKLILEESDDMFFEYIKCLRKHGLTELADKIENPDPSEIPTEVEFPCYLCPPEDGGLIEKPEIKQQINTPYFAPTTLNTAYVNQLRATRTEPLRINVTYSETFSERDPTNRIGCYYTRSKHRGRVLIINNIVFKSYHKTREGAEVDESNLKDMFDRMGFSVNMFRNLTAREIQDETKKFATQKYYDPPDICFYIIMSHGEKINNQNCVVASDGGSVKEDWIINQFCNDICETFENKPKILLFNYCRGDLVDDFAQFSITETDSACFQKPDAEKPEGRQRCFSDMIICHPSVNGYQAHRDTVKGCWYIELICEVFMKNAHSMDIESMLKLVDYELKYRVSERRTCQTATYLNVSFRTCYLNPGIYEENGQIKKFKQSF